MSRMRSTIAVAAVLATAAALAGPASAGTITGTVKYEGKVPNLRPISMDADPNCAKKHNAPVPSDLLVLGSGNTMANILVRVTKGLPAGKTWPVPSTPVEMDQEGCHYQPHVMGIMVGQKFKILNSDGILHNVHALPHVNKQFNMAMPGTRKTAETEFSKPEGVFEIKCDVHPWMVAYIAVMTHPFFDVTKKDGKFTIPNLPPGTYTIEAWHEKLGTRTATVTIADGETKTADFVFKTPSK